MNDERKRILITGIIDVLNEKLKQENSRLCKQNLFSEQRPLHGGNMFFKLAYMDDKALIKIASACGL
uniref:Uncharacterized protein n=1 Tax=viral metagenome TaxID=1070528 RepID=A0A6M3LW17_9ZZZZ